jgi:hypothetical protein
MSCNTNDGNKKNDKYNDNCSKNNEIIEMILKKKQNICDASSCEINFDNIIFDFPQKARDVLLDDTEKQLVDLAASTVSQWKLLWNKQ